MTKARRWDRAQLLCLHNVKPGKHIESLLVCLSADSRISGFSPPVSSIAHLFRTNKDVDWRARGLVFPERPMQKSFNFKMQPWGRPVSKYVFTVHERWAIFRVHGERCYLGREPIDLKTMQVDHIVPESLLDDPESLAKALEARRLRHKQLRKLAACLRRMQQQKTCSSF
ncbi:hypothetical protein [Mycoplana ramosa]|uniref:HNH endonuclease n=1 Tax=Mycoplana ramosa TaxID=40837 RepID=A0ABW3YXN0_MYCRA